MNDWLNCDRDYPSYCIMTDDKILNNLRREEGLQMTTKMMMMKTKNVPSQSNALPSFGISYSLDVVAGGMR